MVTANQNLLSTVQKIQAIVTFLLASTSSSFLSFSFFVNQKDSLFTGHYNVTTFLQFLFYLHFFLSLDVFPSVKVFTDYSGQ